MFTLGLTIYVSNAKMKHILNILYKWKSVFIIKYVALQKLQDEAIWLIRNAYNRWRILIRLLRNLAKCFDKLNTFYLKVGGSP